MIAALAAGTSLAADATPVKRAGQRTRRRRKRRTKRPEEKEGGRGGSDRTVITRTRTAADVLRPSLAEKGRARRRDSGRLHRLHDHRRPTTDTRAPPVQAGRHKEMRSARDREPCTRHELGPRQPADWAGDIITNPALTLIRPSRTPAPEGTPPWTSS